MTAKAITLMFSDGSVNLDCRELVGEERLGQPARFWLVARSEDPVDSASVVGKACVIEALTRYGGRAICGIVTRFGSVAASDPDVLRTYRLEVQSTGARLALARRCRVHQHLSVPDIVTATLTAAGWAADRIDTKGVTGSHAAREYIVQYAETDEAFIRRICEDEGLYFQYDTSPEGDVFSLHDTSTAKTPTLPEPIYLTDIAGAEVSGLAAWQTTNTLRRRPGKVTLRDYDRKKPALALEGAADAGTALEKNIEVYLAPGGFLTKAAGSIRAQLELDALRSDAETVTLVTNAISIAPGDAVPLKPLPGYQGPPHTEGVFFVTALSHEWSFDGGAYKLRARFIPIGVPYRLPKVTPRPRIAGVHSALVTGAPNEEIHPDQDGCVFVRFHWDREGPADNTSSLPVRVMQPNMPGSMNIPRVGWEVWVAFEDGDPNRPYVLGKTFNGKQVPPHPLPANKTMTSVATNSSPGGKATNAISFNDSAGSQHMLWHAGFGKNVTIADNCNIRVGNVEAERIVGSQSRTISGNETVSVGDGLHVQVGSQTASVGTMQNVYVKGNVNNKVGAETVVVGAALLEKIGNPVTGAINLAVNAGIAGVGALGEKIGGLAGKVAPLLGAAAGIGYGMYQAATAPGAGPNAARNAGIRGVMGAVAGHIPGGEALFSSVASTGVKFPWEKPPPPKGAAVAGGGAGASESDGAGAGGPGPGHRETIVKGAMAEGLGGSNIVVTPGSIKWQTSGASLIGVGASHSTKAVSCGGKTLGASFEDLGSFHITASTEAGRDVKGAVTTTISGALKSHAGGQHSIEGTSSVTLKVGGGLTLDGGTVVFGVGGTFVASSPGGILIKASTITIKKKTKQDGKAVHL
jgi:type VI secretion system secreted protein VgrG